MFEFIVVVQNPYLSSFATTPAISTRPATALLFIAALLSITGTAGPAWLLSLWTIAILIAVAIVEWNVGKDMALFEMLEPFMPFLKALVAVMVSLALLDSRTADLASTLISEEVATPLWESGLKLVWAILMGILGFIAAIYRTSFYLFISDFDQDNDLGLLTLYSWMEVFFSVTGSLLALVVPVAAIVMYIVTVLGLYALRRQLEQMEENKRVPCKGNCGTTIYPCAIYCPTCFAPNPHPCQVGLLGQTTIKPVTDAPNHPWMLLAQKRCPRCATRFKGRDMHQTCVACGTSVLGSPEAVHAYVATFDAKLSTVMMICFGLGFVPFAGLIAAVIYYRLTLVSPMRRYVPAAQGCLGRWLTRIFNLIMISFQAIPVCGPFILPAMCYVNYQLYRSMMLRSQYRPTQPPKENFA